MASPGCPRLYASSNGADVTRGWPLIATIRSPNPEACMFGRAAAHDIDNRNRARAPIIRTCSGRFVEAQLNGRARVTHVVHPDRPVENRRGREERGQRCKQWTWECGPGAHKRAGTERRVSRVAAYDERTGESIKAQ